MVETLVISRQYGVFGRKGGGLTSDCVGATHMSRNLLRRLIASGTSWIVGWFFLNSNRS